MDVTKFSGKNELYEDIYKSDFSFGKNRQNFLKKLNKKKIENAKKCITDFIGLDNIKNQTVIDFGCGSGLMSLCFVLLGAKKVVSVDVDDFSLFCTNSLKKQYKIADNLREEKKGSVLDESFIKNLGKFDLVYSRGVIHHSGNMRKGLENIIHLVRDKGLLDVAIYNDNKIFLEGTSKFRHRIKKFYSKRKFFRKIISGLYTVYLIIGLAVSGKNPIRYIKNFDSGRGMNFFTDIEDRLGGYPYEYATYQEIESFFKKRGFTTKNIIKARSIGCNELLFKKI